MAWEDFLYPLYLLLIGAIVSGGAVALFTHFLEGRRKKRDNDLEDRRQKQKNDLEDRRKELEIKVEIVSKMDETIRNRLDKALSLTSNTKERPTEDEQIAEVENVKKWYMLEAKSIESKLDTYFLKQIWKIDGITMPVL
jgi:tRNA A37 N6-isopentenylltransferase MiaA